jgi:hypothetical protein
MTDHVEAIGERLGRESANQVIANAERYCRYSRERLELTNQAPLTMVQAELCLLTERRDELMKRLASTPPIGDFRARQRLARAYWALAFVLLLAGFYFTALTFEPFRLGTKAYLYCAGIALAVAFLGDLFLTLWASQRLVKILTTAAFAAIMSSVGCLAVIRGDLFLEELKANTAVTVVIDDAPIPAAPRNTFYEDTAGLLRVAMLLISLGIDLAAGLAVREALRHGANGSDDPKKLSVELDQVNTEMVVKLGNKVALENAPAALEARFWQDFYFALLTHATRSAMTKLTVFILATLFLSGGFANGQAKNAEVIAIDLSQSVDVAGPDHKTEFQKNLDAVARLLGDVPADTHVDVIGITDHSFTQPDILLSAIIPGDPGYFAECLSAARSEMVKAWKARSAKLQPRYRSTDIIGALVLAGQIFDRQPGASKKMLVIYSDMRNSTADLDLESLSPVSQFEIASEAAMRAPAGLRNVEIYVRGVDGSGKSIGYWQSLRDFWAEVFRKQGAMLSDYSTLRTQ